MRNLIVPKATNVTSRAWAFYVNRVAASPFVPRRRRAQMYRRLGIDTHTDLIFPRCYFHSADVSIGEGTWLNHGVHLENVAHVSIGARSGLGIFTTVITSTHELGPHRQRLGEWVRKPVTIGDGCWIAARCVILPGVTIADGCVVGAGSVVRADCAPDGFYAGVPAKRIRDLEPGEAESAAAPA